jgi:hypothetical protein
MAHVQSGDKVRLILPGSRFNKKIGTVIAVYPATVVVRFVRGVDRICMKHEVRLVSKGE